MFPFERLYILTLLETYPCVMQNSARAVAEISNILRKGEMIVSGRKDQSKHDSNNHVSKV